MDAVPVKPGAGSKLTTPSVSTLHTPSAVVSVFWMLDADGSRLTVDRSTSLFASLTLSDKSIVATVSAATLTLSAVDTGAAPATVTETVALFDSLPSSSSTVYGVVAVPSKSASGSKLTTPWAFALHTPSPVVNVFWLPDKFGSRSIVVTSTSFSASETLSVKSMVATVSAATVAESSVATGAVLGGVSLSVMRTVVGTVLSKPKTYVSIRRSLPNPSAVKFPQVCRASSELDSAPKGAVAVPVLSPRIVISSQ